MYQILANHTHNSASILPNLVLNYWTSRIIIIIMHSLSEPIAFFGLKFVLDIFFLRNLI